MAELYFGAAANSGTAVPGTTPGYTYAVDAAGGGIAYNTDVTAATAPTWGDTGQEFGLMMLISENPPGAVPVAGMSRRYTHRMAEAYRFSR